MALSKVGKNQVDQSASLTVDGDLTVDTNTLYVDSTNNRVGMGISPLYALHTSTSSGVNRFESTAATGEAVIHTFNRDGQTAYIGKENSAGNYTFAYGGVADAFAIAHYGSTAPIQIGHNTPELIIDSSGRVTMPSQVGFSAFKVSPFSVRSTGQYVTYTNVDHNVGNHYNSSTGIFTCPIAGRYLVLHSHLTYSSGSGFAIVKNSSFVRQSYVGGGNWQQPAISTVLNCAANDTIRIYADNNTYLHDNQYGMFSVHLMA